MSHLKLLKYLLLCYFFVSVNGATGCDDPAVHPEMAAFNALLASLPVQPPGPVQLKFRVDGEGRIGNPLTIRIAFWQKESGKGRFIVIPSPGLELDGSPDRGEIPYRGSVDLRVRATEKGYHYLKVETTVEVAGVETQRTNLIGLSVALDDKTASEITQSSRFDFAGSRLRQVLMDNQSKAVASPTDTE